MYKNTLIRKLSESILINRISATNICTDWKSNCERKYLFDYWTLSKNILIDKIWTRKFLIYNRTTWSKNIYLTEFELKVFLIIRFWVKNILITKFWTKSISDICILSGKYFDCWSVWVKNFLVFKFLCDNYLWLLDFDQKYFEWQNLTTKYLECKIWTWIILKSVQEIFWLSNE